jgi:hypothetical protein
MTGLTGGKETDLMSHVEAVSLEAVARLFGRTELADSDAAAALAGTTLLFDGYGSIARPKGEDLARRGAARFVLADPKSYVAASVSSQCTSDEVGRLKADVGAERLRALGAEVTAFARDIWCIPEGVVAQNAIVITTVDNRRADIVSNRRAARMGARLIKVNVEPALEVATVRAYDFRQQTRLCVECQFNGHHYAAQRHPKSCDGAIDARRTNSPRWLSQAAAQLGVLATLDLAADGPAANQWVAHEWQYFPRTGVVVRSCLEPKPACRWDHDRRWRNLVRLREGADSISLRELCRAAGVVVDARVKIRFCQQVAMRGRCVNCRTDVSVVRWFTDLQAPVGTCPSCGSLLSAVPFAVFSTTSLEPLLMVLDEPLAQWGLERFAVIELTRDDRCTTFVVGGT